MHWYLFPLSFIFWIIVIVRNKLFDRGWLESKKYKIPIISIGNITVGGTGKTPHAEYLINWLSQFYRVALLSRGYMRKTKGYFEVQTHSTVSQVGDEPLQIKQKFPNITVVVDEKRVNAIDKLLQEPNAPELVILDDAFQHRHVNPGLKMLLVDYQRPIFNDWLLPVGNLREPAKNAKRADIILVTKCPFEMQTADFDEFAKKLKIHQDQELFFTTFNYGTIQPVFENTANNSIIRLNGFEVLGVSGIANPLPFYKMLEKLGATLHKMPFPDHHMFSDLEIQQIANRFLSIQKEDKYIITTEKDAMRMRSSSAAHILSELPVYYMPIAISFLNGGEEKFRKRVEEYLSLTKVK